MPTTTELIDGKFTLQQQEDTLNFMEQQSLSKLIAYSKSAEPAPGGGNANAAQLDGPVVGDPLVDGQPPLLKLTRVPDGQNLATVITPLLTAGGTVVFIAIVFVEGNETNVVVSREKSKK